MRGSGRAVLLLQSVAAFATALFASLGLLIAAVTAFHGRRRLSPEWALLWSGFFLPLLAVGAAFGSGESLRFPTTMLPVCLAASWAQALRPTSVARGLAVALAVLLTTLALDLTSSAFTWQPPSHTSLVGTAEQLVNRTIQSPGGSRTWYLPAGAAEVPLRLSFDARLVQGLPGSTWQASSADIDLTTTSKGHLRADFPDKGDPYLMRTYILEDGVAGRRFRAEVELRSENPLPPRPTRGLWLQAWGEGGGAGILPGAVERDWRTFALEWTAPHSASTNSLRLILNDFDGQQLDVRAARVSVLDGGNWVLLPLPDPLGMEVRLTAGSGQGMGTPRVLPTSDWRHFELELPPASQDSLVVRAQITLEPGLAVETRDVSITAGGAARPLPLPSWNRRSLWFGHPNNAGHTLLLIGLVAMLALRSPASALGVLITTLAAVAFTGSRTALAAGFLGLPLLLLLKLPARRAVALAWLTAAMAVLVAAFLARAGAGDLIAAIVGGPGLSRQEIWAVAWRAMLERPWTGVGSGAESFAAFFSSAYPGNIPEPIPNAHNLWLVFASEYGIPGLLASLWLTCGLLFLGWRWGGWQGISFLLPVLLLNFFDYSLFSWWPLFLVIMGLNLFRETGPTESAGEAGARNLSPR